MTVDGRLDELALAAGLAAWSKITPAATGSNPSGHVVFSSAFGL